jgi:predicted anti-sigma-YlaC factor YlaD
VTPDDERCDHWRDAISARADGEEPGIEPRLIDAHLESCASCRGFERTVATMRRATLVQPAQQMPDLSRRVSKLAAIADRASSWSLVRLALGVVAVEILVLSVPSLLGGGAADAHDARHLGAFTIAYAVSLLAVVVRPARARSVLPAALVLGGALVITAIVDVANGSIPIVAEATHLSELISVLLLWLLAVPSRRRAERRARPSQATPFLRSVERPPETPPEVREVS